MPSEWLCGETFPNVTLTPRWPTPTIATGLQKRIKPIAHGVAQAGEDNNSEKGSFEAPNQDAWTYSNIK